MLKREFLKSSILAASLTLAAGFAPAMAQEKPQIWTYWTSGAEAAALDALMKVASSEYKDAALMHRAISGNTAEMRQALQVAFLGGNPPAIYQSGMAQELKSFVDGGRLAPIDDVWQAIGGDKNIPEGIKKVVSVDGKVYAVPLNVHIVSNVFYNKKTFEKLGLTPPKTWDEFIKVADALKKSGTQALADAGGPGWTLYNAYPAILSTLGKDGYYKLASGELAFNSPEMHKAMQLFADTYAKNYMKDWSGYTWSTAADQFVKGNVAMYQMGDWVSSYFKDAGLKPGVDYDFFPAPTGMSSAIVQLDVLALTANDNATVTAAGKDFLKAAGSPAGQEAFNIKKGSVAANQSAPSEKYDAYGKQAFENLTVATKENNVIPNLKNLLPVQLGDEFGNQIVAYAQKPSPEALDTMLNALEEMRQELLPQNVFVKW